jgi:hypothetical protein
MCSFHQLLTPLLRSLLGFFLSRRLAALMASSSLSVASGPGHIRQAEGRPLRGKRKERKKKNDGMQGQGGVCTQLAAGFLAPGASVWELVTARSRQWLDVGVHCKYHRPVEWFLVGPACNRVWGWVQSLEAWMELRAPFLSRRLLTIDYTPSDILIVARLPIPHYHSRSIIYRVYRRVSGLPV